MNDNLFQNELTMTNSCYQLSINTRQIVNGNGIWQSYIPQQCNVCRSILTNITSVYNRTKDNKKNGWSENGDMTTLNLNNLKNKRTQCPNTTINYPTQSTSKRVSEFSIWMLSNTHLPYWRSDHLHHLQTKNNQQPNAAILAINTKIVTNWLICSTY